MISDQRLIWNFKLIILNEVIITNRSNYKKRIIIQFTQCYTQFCIVINALIKMQFCIYIYSFWITYSNKINQTRFASSALIADVCNVDNNNRLGGLLRPVPVDVIPVDVRDGFTEARCLVSQGKEQREP